ncbi:hypothetical protein CDD82_3928 [Ophiocordyceps australis]|uniref:Protein HRI1 n=1 Tax=Ophiocordyceps australis TaxID=1399860 RepID=A0A2C5ZSP8_9HYPO|nr:hypothetical protein CDD82_3928 [Ophiocordyceps australis]
MGSISIRRSIRWLPGEPEEPTCTVVLTSPSRRFVDLRILKSNEETCWPENWHQEKTLPLERLDWAIAGTSATSATAGGVEHVVWRHWIDSRTQTPEHVVDQGDVIGQSDGTVLETGRGLNPATGTEEAYQEVWEDNEVRASACLVLSLDDGGRRGMVIRLGRYCQGLLRSASGLTVERWRWNDAGGWAMVVRMGGERIPCSFAVGATTAEMGQGIGAEFEGWMVVEAQGQGATSLCVQGEGRPGEPVSRPESRPGDL